MDQKHCSRCDRDKLLDEFYNNKRYSDGKDNWCAECRKSYGKDYRQTNPDKVTQWQETRAQSWSPEDDRKYRVLRIAEIRAWLDEMREATPCADCGQKFPAVCMDFDHVRGVKSHTIAKMVGDGYTKAAILEELEKCELVCSNCHRIRTHCAGRPRPWSDARRKYDRDAWESSQ